MMDGVDLDVSQARVNLLPDKHDRHRISQALAIRRLSSRHYKRPMSEGNACSGWMLLLLLVCSLHHIHSKYWRSFKRHHWLLVCFISLPVALSWKVGKKLFELLTVLCGALVMCHKVVCGLWLFLKWCCLATKILGELDDARPSQDMVGSKVTKEPIHHVLYEMCLYSGLVGVWFRPLQLRSLQLIIRRHLIMSGDVELNPGPLDQDQKVENILLTVDNKPFDRDDWNIVVMECKSLAAKWEQLSIYLGLSCDVIDNIKGSGDNYHCWSEALKHWIRQNFNTKKFDVPSWRSLLKAVAEVDKLQFKKLAEKHQAAPASVQVKDVEKHIERLNLHVRASSVQESKATGDKVHTSSTTQPATKPDGATSGSHTHTASTNDHPTMPIITLDRKEHLYERRCFESEQMMFKFQQLFTVTKKSLRDKKVPVAELVDHLGCLGFIKPTFKDSGLPSLRHQLPELANAETVDAVMSVVKDYCSFFNYHMLEHIIDEFGTQQDKENMTSYKEDFNQYAECCITECPTEVGKMSEEGSANLFVTLDDSFDNCALSHLNIFIGNLRKILNIPKNVALRLCRINLGSIKLIFQIPHSVQQAIFPLSSEQKAELSSLGVVQLSCGDYQFTRQQTKKGVEEPAAGGDSDHTDSEGTVDSKNTCDAELSSMAAGLAVAKPRGTFSICADSAIGRSSVITGTTARVTQFSEDLVDRELCDLEMGMEHGVADGSAKNELHRASRRGNLKKVKELTEEKQFNPLQRRGKHGMNALHYAAHYGQLGVLRYFIEERGCNPASQDNEAWTPLHYAAYGKHLDIVHYLVAKQQMDPLCCADNGTTPLHIASQAGDINFVRYLVNELNKFLPLKDIVTSRGKDGRAPIHFAATCGHLDIAQHFISKLNCDPNIATPVVYQGKTTVGGGRIALHGAAQRGHLHIVKYLVEQCNCNPLHLDNERVTPLHMAAQEGHLEVVQYLILEQHCDTLCTNKKRNIPLHNAAYNGHLQVVKFFIESLHCPLDIRGVFNMTPLELAHSQGHHHVVQYLESIHP